MTNRAEQPEVRVSPDGSKVAVRWLPTQTMTWRVVDVADSEPSSLESDGLVEGWQPLVPLFAPTETEDSLRQEIERLRAELAAHRERVAEATSDVIEKSEGLLGRLEDQ